MKDTYVGTIIMAQVKNQNDLESTLQSSADIMLKHYNTVLRKEVDRLAKWHQQEILEHDDTSSVQHGENSV